MPAPPFFRYSYFLARVGYQGGVKSVYCVHGYVFTFYRPKPWVKDLVEMRVREVMGDFNEAKNDDDRDFEDHSVTWDDDMGNDRLFEAEEEEQVDVEEVRGVGFYYPRVLINDIEIEKADIRRGLWKLMGLVSRAVSRVVSGA